MEDTNSRAIVTPSNKFLDLPVLSQNLNSFSVDVKMSKKTDYRNSYRVCLPTAEINSRSAVPAGQSLMNTPQKIVTKGLILIVDDTPDNLRLLSAMLKEYGYDVRKALSGKAALMVLQVASPDLILLDIMMPEMDGFEVCKHLKANDKTAHIPIIFLSALDNVSDKVKAFTMGGVDYITKPFHSQEVLARIESHITVQRLQAKLSEQNLQLRQEVEERRQTEEALRRAEIKNGALLNAIPDLMFRVSADGVFLDYRSAKSIGDRELVDNPDSVASDRTWIGKTISEAFPEDLAAWTLHYIEQTLTSNQSQIGEYVERTGESWHVYEARYVTSGPGEVLAIVRDISDRKQVEAALRQSEAQLRFQQRQLQNTLNELQQTQTQLVQNAKMVSLGQLAAGIAHEINNPVNFIYGNISYVAQYTKDLLVLLQMCREAIPKTATDIQTAFEEYEADYIAEDLPKLMESMQAGADRIRIIVQSLRNFCRLGEAELKPVDLCEGIESTLTMLQHRLKGELSLAPDSTIPPFPPIQVIKEYATLPLVECYPREINQVFMNILTNAIDALEMQYGSRLNGSASGSGGSKEEDVREGTQSPGSNRRSTPQEPPIHPTITIRTKRLETERVAISISDNGPGMPEIVQERVFDPFFTTKAVGCGTGLGLSISYQIVVDGHRGLIHCESQLGIGTTFTVEIPIRQPK